MKKSTLRVISLGGLLVMAIMLFLMACTPRTSTEGEPSVDSASPPAQDLNDPDPIRDDTPDLDIYDLCQQSLSGNMCNDPYFPPIEGLTLVYDLSSPVLGQVTQTRQIGALQTGLQSGDGQVMDGYPMLISGPSGSFEIPYGCTQDGMLVNEQQMITGVLDEMAGGQIEVMSTAFEGVTYPKVVSPGDTWSSKYTMVLSESQSGEQIHFITNYQHRFAGYEQVDTPAGSFQARRFDIKGQMDMGLYPTDTAGMPSEMLTADGFFSLATIPIEMTIWVAECVGVVRSEITVSCIGGCPQGESEQTTFYELKDMILP